MNIKELIDTQFGKDSTVSVGFLDNASTLVLKFDGSFDLQSSSAMLELLLSVINRMDRSRGLVVDLENVSYIPSTGVGALTMVLTTAKKREIPFKVYRIQPKVRAVFELLGFMNFFEEADHYD